MELSALSLLTAAIAVAYGVLYIAYGYVRVLYLRRRMPPGPFPFPVFGNIFQITPVRHWMQFEEWSHTYKSPIITIWEGRRPTVVCNDAWSMSELCDKRANIYSSRAIKNVSGKIFGLHKFNQAGLPYGEQWKVHRRLTHAAANAQVVQTYRPVQEWEAKILAFDCMRNPEMLVDNLLRFTVSLASIVAWGRRIKVHDDGVLKVARGFVGSANLGFPGKTYTEAIPELMHLPQWLNPLPNMVRRLAQTSNKYFYALCVEAQESSQDNFAKRLLREKQEQGLTKIEIANLTGNFIGGGVDTTTSTILSFMLAMILHPDIQKKAQQEIDAVVGPDQSPTWSHQSELPYLTAILTETLRWRPAFPLGGPPHAPIADDIYEQYLIPKGTSVIGNLHAISRNPREYPQPERFWPDRFLDDFDKPPYPNKRGHHTFGWGRRVCSGEPLVHQSMFIIAVNFLWAFNIRPGLDDKGREVFPDPKAYGVSQVSSPLPFRVRLEPRSEAIKDMLTEDAAAATLGLQAYDGETRVTFESAQSVSLDMPVARAEA
ncbi:hypothetical protein G7Z17_g1446 [Cylindrodendrum hubeiense]|uniref:Cytochrome P450 n=1 Tax=Cylindrodendrum hubeiense TaxID=595255 RepID=A0A9P5HJP1_9HYPO|nr:hypothetical protein G7Z17_g1446 [Cylindrodendrum hubeiense]